MSVGPTETGPRPRGARHEALRAEARSALVGGVLGEFSLPDEVAFLVARGAGAHLYDPDGRAYLDFLLGSGPLILGHAHPAVVAAVQHQAALGAHYFLPSEPTIRLAGELIAAGPCAELVRFVGTGSEATFAALRLARAFTGRARILKFEGGFHGTHDYAQFSIAARPSVPFPTARPETAGIPPVLRREVLVAPFNDLETTGALVAAHAAELAAVIVEPLQRCLPPQPGFLEGLRELTRQHGALLIFDELITGFRLAYGGAQERYGVVPDLACYGKVLSGGYPLAAVAGRAEIMALCDAQARPRGRYVAISGTHAGHPLAAAAGLATLAELRRPGVYERLRALGSRLRAGLVEVGRRHGLPLRTIGEDTVFQPLIADFEPVDARSKARIDWRRTATFGREMVRRGVLLYRTAYLSTAHTEADLDQVLAVADEVAALLAPEQPTDA